jgi:hypothetical protein
VTPVTTYILNIHGRIESVPAKSPCGMLSENIGTARRCSFRHHSVPIRFRAHEETSTITVPYIARMPNATGIGLNVVRIGTNKSGRSNGTNRSSANPIRWIAKNANPALAVVAWNAVDARLEIRFVTREVVDTSPHAVDRNSAR